MSRNPGSPPLGTETSAREPSQLRELKKTILWAAHKAQEGHVPSALSILDLLWVEFMDVMPRQKRSGDPVDRFVLSKGHASLGLYAILAESGHFPTDWLSTFCSYDSPLGGHPDRLKVPGVEVSSGSLGHGLPIGAGMALGGRLQQDERRVVVLIGDGEANEGTTWEAAAFAVHHQLTNLLVICDDNGSTKRALNLNSIEQKFSAFGWSVDAVDGHNHDEIRQALLTGAQGQPRLIVAATIKGKGIAEMEGNPAWHHKSPSLDQLDAFLMELE